MPHEPTLETNPRSKRRRSNATSRRRSPRWSGCRAPSWPTRSAIGVPERSARCACSSSGTGSMCAARSDSTPMTSVSKELRARARPAFHAGAAGSRGRAGVGRRHAQMAAATARREAGERPHLVEWVYIPETDRGTLCVSSQVGCTLTCSFCHTGTQRLVRNLTAGEIVGQIMVARDRLGDSWVRSGCKAAGTADRRRALRLQHRDDGDGRAALQFRSGARRASAWWRTATGSAHLQAPHHALDLGRGAEHRARRRRDRLHAGGIAACGA